jgi:hypothetical protein
MTEYSLYLNRLKDSGYHIEIPSILHTDCIHLFRTMLRINSYYFLNSISRLVFVIETQCVFYGIYMIFKLQRAKIFLCRQNLHCVQ